MDSDLLQITIKPMTQEICVINVYSIEGLNFTIWYNVTTCFFHFVQMLKQFEILKHSKNFYWFKGSAKERKNNLQTVDWITF